MTSPGWGLSEKHTELSLSNQPEDSSWWMRWCNNTEWTRLTNTHIPSLEIQRTSKNKQNETHSANCKIVEYTVSQMVHLQSCYSCTSDKQHQRASFFCWFFVYYRWQTSVFLVLRSFRSQCVWVHVARAYIILTFLTTFSGLSVSVNSPVKDVRPK